MHGKHTGTITRKLITAAIMLAGCLFAAAVPAFADYRDTQGETTTLRNPLIPGASYADQLMPAPMGQPPPIGDGPTPLPVIPGDNAPIPPPTGTADPPCFMAVVTRES